MRKKNDIVLAFWAICGNQTEGSHSHKSNDKFQLCLGISLAGKCLQLRNTEKNIKRFITRTAFTYLFIYFN